MEYQYKIIIYNKNFYKEFEIPNEMRSFKLGTTTQCDFRLNSDYFFEDIEILFEKKDVWTVLCNDDLYIAKENIIKILYSKLSHGDVMDICYSTSGEKAFELKFLINFEAEIPSFGWKIDISNRNCTKFSYLENKDVHIISSFINAGEFDIRKIDENYYLVPIKYEFDICINGKKIDTKTKIKDLDFISNADFACFFKDGEIYFDKNKVELYELKATAIDESVNCFEYPLFNRNTRIKSLINVEKIPLLVPASKPKKPEDNLAMTLFPALTMLALVIVVRGFMSNSSNNTFVIFSVCSMSMGIITSIASYVSGKKKYKKACEKRLTQYEAYINKKKEEIQNARAEERTALVDNYRSIEESLDIIKKFDRKLFDRNRTDEDFLHIYLGTGDVKARREIDYKKPEALATDDALMLVPDDIVREYEYIKECPIVVDLKKAGVIGILGETSDNFSFAKNIIIDIITRQHVNDLQMILLIPEKCAMRSWSKYIPNLVAESGMRNLVYNKTSRDNVFENLYKELSMRSILKNPSVLASIVVIVLEEWGIKNHPISQYMDKAADLNVNFVFFENTIEQLPQNCAYIISLKNDQTGEIYSSENKRDVHDFKYSVISEFQMMEACERLWPIYCEEISLESTLRKNISLFELLDIYSVNDIDLSDRWNQSKVYESMAAPLGINSKNEIIYLDLHEKAHGPHGLVAGTTGSGKSEILQTYILTMATLFHPYEVSFVIIDFKGGGMVNQFKTLPHLNGAITNIDGREIERSLKSIKAELLKRQELFAKANVNHIDKYIRLYKNGDVEIPLPHLIIIVDEFAELKAEQPEFMKELISAARIGRSLGVHLILATQKPSGQVNEQIWSNSRFKLCLKVQSKEDSNEVLKSPLAAEIKEPGRAYLQVGNNEVFELLQSGYSGEKEKTDDIKQKEFVISEVELSGKRNVVFQQKASGSGQTNRTQLEAVVDYIHMYCEKNNIKMLNSICLPALSDYILIGKNTDRLQLNDISVGIYDDPEHQYQGVAKFNFCECNTLIVGASGTGKTNLLQVIIRQMCQNFSPEEVVFYLIDFGAMYLKNYEMLNHVGGVVTVSEEEKLKNLFKLVLEEIQHRKTVFSKIGISSYTAYIEAGYSELPQIILMMDNFAAFKEVYADEYEEEFLYIIREGLAYGISCLICNVQTNGLGYKYMANFANKIAFSCNDSGEYSNLFDRCRMEPKDICGRALCSINKVLYEMQTFIAFAGEKEIDRSNAIKSFIMNVNNANIGKKARKIPSIPDQLTYEYLLTNYKQVAGKHQYPLGLEYSNVDVVTLDTNVFTEFTIIGNNKEMCIFAIRAIVMSAIKNILEAEIEFYVVDDIQRSLKEVKEFPWVEEYSIDYSLIGEWLLEIQIQMEERYDLLMEEGIEKVQDMPLKFIIINNRDAIEYISKTKSVLEIYNRLVQKYKALGIFFLFADIDDAAVPYGAPELLKRFKEQKNGLILTKNLKEVKFCDIPTSVARTMKPLGSGDAYMLNKSSVQKIKLVEAENIWE